MFTVSEGSWGAGGSSAWHQDPLGHFLPAAPGCSTWLPGGHTSCSSPQHHHPAVSSPSSPFCFARQNTSIPSLLTHPLILPPPQDPELPLPRSGRFLHCSVSLCGIFGAGTTLTVLGESLTSSRSFFPHREIVTFCRFLVIWGFFLDLAAGWGLPPAQGRALSAAAWAESCPHRAGGLRCAPWRT